MMALAKSSEEGTVSKQFDHGYALLVGVDESQVARWALPDVLKDIAALEKVLVHPDRCAYPGDHVKKITGAEATRDSILDGLHWLQERVQADGSGDATAVVYYTGHGWRPKPPSPPRFFLVPYNVREGQLASRALRAEDFAEAVSGIQSKRLLVILDCCHAGGMGVKGGEETQALPDDFTAAAIPPTLLVKGEGALGPGATKGIEELAKGSGRAVLCSSTGEQSSYVRRDRKMSIFTYHLIEALTGHAQPQEGATEVLVSDVMGHVTRRVPASARDQGEQMPDYQVSGNFPVALLLGGKGLSKGQPAPDPLEQLPEVSAPATYHAEVRGSGAIAQGPGAMAAGAGGVAVGGSVEGGIHVTREEEKE
jgi:uncharacterized caspase-like protein